MPQPAPTVSELIASFTAEIDQLIEAAVAARLTDVFARLRPDLSAPAATPKRSPPSRSQSVGPTRPASSPVRLSPPPAAPPRLFVRKVATPPTPALVVALPKPKLATIIPADVKITRLPPGPVPGARRSYSELRSQCRVPGCQERNSGPRFDLMCRDHYARFNAAERQKFKEMWKAGQAP